MDGLFTKRRRLSVALLATAGAALSGRRALAAAAISEGDAAGGIRAALQRGAIAAVGALGRTDGFLGNPKVRIPLPGVLNQAAKLLKAIGQGQKVDDLVTAMNRAAEAAVPEARALLVDAALAISVDDAVAIVRGGDTSATDYFNARTRTPLAAKFLPIVTRATERVALAARYNAVAAKAQSLGLLQGDDANVQQYVTAKALDGLFVMIGDEERKIRANPIGTGSAILRKVFGG